MAQSMIETCNAPQELRRPGRMSACAIVTDAEGAAIKDEMLQKSMDEAIAAAGWDPGTVVNESDVLACPMPDRGTNSPCMDEQTMKYEVQKRAGWYTVEAVKDFLQPDPAVQADTDYQGLLMDYTHGGVQKLRHKCQPIEKAMLRPDELVGYVERESPSLQGDWQVRV
ncbi:hypothetical protein LTR86_000089 [Recurvomyces mirabilis]|nr:hypothetical protein LTR86_000089 [Recurvomyces mirabilis]